MKKSKCSLDSDNLQYCKHSKTDRNIGELDKEKQLRNASRKSFNGRHSKKIHTQRQSKESHREAGKNACLEDKRCKRDTRPQTCENRQRRAKENATEKHRAMDIPAMNAVDEWLRANHNRSPYPSETESQPENRETRKAKDTIRVLRSSSEQNYKKFREQVTIPRTQRKVSTPVFKKDLGAVEKFSTSTG